MACYHPIHAFYRVLEDGKKDIVFCNCEEDKHAKFLDRNGHLYCNPIQLPCGMCIGCRLEYSKQWSIRCVLESLKYKCNWFLTLTYDDEHLPWRETDIVDPDTLQTVDYRYAPSLDPDRLQKFMKDLRQYMEYHYQHVGIRFFSCGEYGDLNGRPHYHVLLFNCPFPDIKLLKKSQCGSSLFQSDILDQLWPDGMAVIGEVNYASCAYTARYIMKKQKGPGSAQAYEELGILPEFVRMSRRPGIGRDYYDQNSDRIYRYDKINIVGSNGKVIEAKPPHYFDRLFEDHHPDEMFHVKQVRESTAKERWRSELQNTDLNEEQYLAVCEANCADRLTRLKRVL